MAACRCGATLPVDPKSSPAEVVPADSGGGSGTIIAIVVAVLLLGAAGYWYFIKPAAEVISANAASEESEPLDAATPAPATPSAAARAWDAAANAREITPAAPDAAPTTEPTPLPAAPLSASIEEMVDRVMPAVVLIQATGGRGSGFFVRHDTLITNVHVVENDGYVTLRRSDGTTMNARVETRAPAFDIAILKVATPSATQVVIPMGSARTLKPGQEIVVIGSALGTLQNSVSRGVVSGVRNAGGATMVQTDAAANPGNSGGPMLDRNGAVIGITTLKLKNSEGLNFGVAIDHARDLLEGRQTNLGSSRGLAEIESTSRDASETDRQQQQGEEQFKARIGQMVQGAANIDDAWKRYRSQCYKSAIAGTYDREWFAMLRTMPGDAAGGCPEYYAELGTAVKDFRRLMQQTLVDARRANVLPGTVRDALRQNRLDLDWDR